MRDRDGVGVFAGFLAMSEGFSMMPAPEGLRPTGRKLRAEMGARCQEERHANV